MAKRLKASALRENIDRIFDPVAETGVPAEIERQGKEPANKLDNLRPRPYILSDPENLVHLDWSSE